jgi:hypothetical protein
MKEDEAEGEGDGETRRRGLFAAGGGGGIYSAILVWQASTGGRGMYI